ncbi:MULTISPECIES: hypothetical protein [unclassified Crossiella]|uniref:hypothetical protein n=1 Tax=unclassified Crossiella TaxID=2620835 RepID=UPI001FFF50DB|nr:MULTISPECIES: hypothetical protein [unclassified Crossiella]MCK2237425.1 hypothetical protein [Crossiella sp. S99.2]MCK2251080.1 hypothetical protein [Crossiella sp. S99.1]
MNDAIDAMRGMQRIAADAEHAVRKGLEAIGVGWAGQAAEAMTAAARPAVAWAQGAQDAALSGGTSASSHGMTFAETKPKVEANQPVQEPGVGALVLGAFSPAVVVAMQHDMQQQLAANRARDDAANRALYGYESTARDRVGALPVLPEAPKIALDSGGSPPPPQPPPVPPGGRNPRDPRQRDLPRPGGTGADPGRQGQDPGRVQPGAGTDPVRPVENTPDPTLQGVVPSGTGGGNTVLPRVEPPPVGGPGQPGGTGGGGGFAGGFYGGGSAGGGVGSGAGGPGAGLRGPGGQAGVAPGQPGARAAAPVAGAGRAGVGGQSFLQSPTGAAGRPEEDDEHENKFKTRSDDIYGLDDLPRIPPPVIGEHHNL